MKLLNVLEIRKSGTQTLIITKYSRKELFRGKNPGFDEVCAELDRDVTCITVNENELVIEVLDRREEVQG